MHSVVPLYLRRNAPPLHPHSATRMRSANNAAGYVRRYSVIKAFVGGGYGRHFPAHFAVRRLAADDRTSLNLRKAENGYSFPIAACMLWMALSSAHAPLFPPSNFLYDM